jgi:hypothetical protein
LPFSGSILSLVNTFGLQEHSDELFALEEGQLSSAIEFGAGEYLLFFMQERPGIDEEEAEEMFREQLVMERRADMFTEMLDQWVEDANYTINQRALNAF